MKSFNGPAIFRAQFMGGKPRLEESLPVVTGELAAGYLSWINPAFLRFLTARFAHEFELARSSAARNSSDPTPICCVAW